MNPQGTIDPPKGERRRVLSLESRTPAARPWRPVDPNPAGAPTRDWLAWICLGLGILCGGGALYYALEVISAGP